MPFRKDNMKNLDRILKALAHVQNVKSQLEPLETAVDRYVEFVKSDNYIADGENNYQNDIFEKAVIAIAGEKVWDELLEILEKKNGS